MDFQYMLTGLSAGHGDMGVYAVNVPVSVGGMDVAPGEIVHMDENGACKFPSDKIEAVLTNAKALQVEEEDRMGRLQQATSAAEIRAIFAGQSYAKSDD
jgi:regulator of RNase E activity RraA